MNTRQAIDESTGPVSLSVAFNQDSSCFSVGHDTGFCGEFKFLTVLKNEVIAANMYRQSSILSPASSKSHEVRHFPVTPSQIADKSKLILVTDFTDFNAGIGVAEMLGRANYIALVGGGKQPKFPQNKVIIWDDAKQTAVITLEFRSQVHRVCLSRTRIVVVLQNSVHMYAFSSPPEKLSIFETADNFAGLCCLGSKVVAFPGRTHGQVQMVEIATGNVSIIPAHGTPLRALELSPDGEILATASETGTLIRVFSTSNCARIGELRRGVDPAVVYSIAISPNSTLLAVTSDKSTLHVFDLPSQISHSRNGSMSSNRPHHNSANSFSTTSSAEEGNKQKWGILGKIPLLPRVFSDIYSFTSAHFEIDDDPQTDLGKTAAMPIPGIPGGKPRKGVIGWKNDYTVLVIGAGRDGRWEKFILGEGDDGRRHLVRNGWKRYLGS